MMQAMLEGSTTAPDGRRIAYTERGDLSGPPAFIHHGTPGTRIGGNPDDDAYAGMRAICHDRPGYGQSDRLHGRDVAAVAGDVRVLADALGIDHFGVIGVSGGGPHALACAALLPERVTRVGVLVGAAPSDDPEFDFVAGMAELNVREFSASQESDEAYAKVLAPMVELARTKPDALVELIERELPEADRAVLAQERWRSMLIGSMVEAVRQGDAGWLDDGRAFTSPWGFPLSWSPIPRSRSAGSRKPRRRRGTKQPFPDACGSEPQSHWRREYGCCGAIRGALGAGSGREEA